MRLTVVQIDIIKKQTDLVFNNSTNVYLFGSRTQNNLKGGDIDLLIETTQDLNLLKKAQLKNLLETNLNLPVDLLIIQRGNLLTPFQTIAFETSILL